MDTRASRCAIWKLHATPSREAGNQPNPQKGGYPAPDRVTFLNGPNRDFPKRRRQNVIPSTLNSLGIKYICSIAAAALSSFTSYQRQRIGKQSSMSEYEVLGEKEWKKRRTIADAIDVLQKSVGFDGDDRGQIQLGRMRLPSGDVVSLTWVSFESAAHRKTFIVKLPTALKFKATSQDELLIDDIGRLEGATLDEKGNVELKDGTLMRAVEIIPALLPYEISAL